MNAGGEEAASEWSGATPPASGGRFAIIIRHCQSSAAASVFCRVVCGHRVWCSPDADNHRAAPARSLVSTTTASAAGEPSSQNTSEQSVINNTDVVPPYA